jgi:hypothetical protein
MGNVNVDSAAKVGPQQRNAAVSHPFHMFRFTYEENGFSSTNNQKAVPTQPSEPGSLDNRFCRAINGLRFFPLLVQKESIPAARE